MRRQIRNLLLFAAILGLSSCSILKDDFRTQKYTKFKKSNIELPALTAEEVPFDSELTRMSTNRAVTISATADDKTNIVLSDFVRTETKRSLLTEADVAPVLIHSGQITKLFRKNATSSYLKPKTGAGNKSPVITEEGLLLLILAIFIPPLAVYLAVDICDAFWINIILTLLFLLPGIIHAIYVILNEY